MTKREIAKRVKALKQDGWKNIIPDNWNFRDFMIPEPGTDEYYYIQAKDAKIYQELLDKEWAK